MKYLNIHDHMHFSLEREKLLPDCGVSMKENKSEDNWNWSMYGNLLVVSQATYINYTMTDHKGRLLSCKWQKISIHYDLCKSIK